MHFQTYKILSGDKFYTFSYSIFKLNRQTFASINKVLEALGYLYEYFSTSRIHVFDEITSAAQQYRLQSTDHAIVAA